MDRFDRKIVVALSVILFYLTVGTVFFHAAEGWSYVDSFYFSGVTLTTVGYGDLTPTHDLSKIVAVIFAFSGIGVVFYSIGVIAQKYFEREEERLQKIWETTRAKNEELKERREKIRDGLKSELKTINSELVKRPVAKILTRRQRVLHSTQQEHKSEDAPVANKHQDS